MRVDAHQHFWRYDPARYPWITDPLAALRRDFLPEHLEPALDAAGVDVTVAVQARQDFEETRWLLGLAGDRVRGVVGWLDLRAPERLAAQLDEVAGDPRLVGVRHLVQDEPDDFLDREDFREGVRAAVARGAVFDLLVLPRQLPAAVRFARALDGAPMVLDHLAKPRVPAGEIEPWATHVRALAALPHVACKVSGLVTEADWSAWRPQDFDPYLDVALDAFGPARLLYGSDWPVCTLAADHAAVHGLAERFAERLSPDERSAFFGGNAVRVYDLPTRPVAADPA